MRRAEARSRQVGLPVVRAERRRGRAPERGRGRRRWHRRGAAPSLNQNEYCSYKS